MTSNNLPEVPDRKIWFENLKKILRLIIKKPEFIFLGEKFEGQAFFLSNHVGASAPLTLELYGSHPFRFWGTFEMNSGLSEVYKYLTVTYYHKKKHWNLTLARLFCLIAAPLVTIFYRGLNLISTYPDMRFHKTVRESLNTLKNGHSLFIFPEDSSDGYHDELTYFHSGLIFMAEQAIKAGYDLPMFLAYYQKPNRRYIIDKPIRLSELLKKGESREAIAEMLRQRCNDLGKMTLAES